MTVVNKRFVFLIILAHNSAESARVYDKTFATRVKDIYLNVIVISDSTIRDNINCRVNPTITGDKRSNIKVLRNLKSAVAQLANKPAKRSEPCERESDRLRFSEKKTRESRFPRHKDDDSERRRRRRSARKNATSDSRKKPYTAVADPLIIVHYSCHPASIPVSQSVSQPLLLFSYAPASQPSIIKNSRAVAIGLIDDSSSPGTRSRAAPRFVRANHLSEDIMYCLERREIAITRSICLPR